MSEQAPKQGREILHGKSNAVLTASGLAPATTLQPPTTLHILPIGERPFFPTQTLPVLLDPETWSETVRQAAEMPQRMIGLVLARTNNPDASSADELYAMGSVVRMHHPMRTGDRIQFIAEGVQRFRVTRWLSQQRPFLAQVEYPKEPRPSQVDQIKAYAIAIISTLRELMPLNPLYSEELKFSLSRFSPNDPSPLVDFAASVTTAAKEDLQEVLETIDLRRRMEKTLVLIRKELEVAKLQNQIQQNVEEKISEHQRRFFLREQLTAIQSELGLLKDERATDVQRFKDRLAQLTLPAPAAARASDEIEKLSLLDSNSPEYGMTRSYLDTLTSLPWGRYAEDHIDLKAARRVLARDHAGLDDVKERIIEFLAVSKLKGGVGGSIILLAGPPGVGKTSIGRSIAQALHRPFYRFSLGGMRDEAEIKGHRRTYVGAMPGKFIQSLKEVKVANPVIMLDEVDKIGASYQGDPASALLEALDPEQNREFLDHYLDVRFDLSRVLFICTANQLDTIPAPLLDRMEVIRLAGYITEEKLAIARHHLWPRTLANAGLKSNDIRIDRAALRYIIENYAREAGVRNIEKQLARIVRKVAVKFVESRRAPVRIGVADVERYLGKPLFPQEKMARAVGVVTGLAWTAMGGATLAVEATVPHRKNRGFKVTGQLGEVMQESAAIAYSLVSAKAAEFGARPGFFDDAFVHVHVPAGATPKDGPSAGITLATALLSLARGERLSRAVAMTGELTLTGQVLSVGGIREKIIAARRSRIRELILPAANQRDVEELPAYLRRGLTLHLVHDFDEIVPLVFRAR